MSNSPHEAHEANDVAPRSATSTTDQIDLNPTDSETDKTSAAHLAPGVNATASNSTAPEADKMRTEDRLVQKPGNVLYTVFPTAGADVLETLDFIKANVSDEDLHDWIDVHENPKQWTVEASADEAAKLQGHPGIDRVFKIELPLAPELKEYFIFPVDGRNQELSNATDRALRGILQDRIEKPYLSTLDGELDFWVATMTADEVKKVEEIPGVVAVEPNVELKECSVTPNKLELPLAPAKPTSHVSRAAKEDDYLIFPVDDKNWEQNNTTENILRDMLQARVHKPRISEYFGTLDWWVATISADEAEKVKAVPGVGAVNLDPVLELDPVIPEKVELAQTRAHPTHHVGCAAQKEESYMIFPEDGTNLDQNRATYSALRDMLQERVRKPSISKISGSVKWWVATMTVEEVKKVEAIPGVVAVEPNTPFEPDFDFPDKMPQKTADPTHMISHTTEEKESYVIFPVDGFNQSQTSATDKALRDILQSRIRPPFYISPFDGKLNYWVADMTADEVDKARELPGVKGVSVNVKPEYC